jgi:fructose-1,6-bisphosphatase/inositol monophosphatase family enzyme
MPLTDDLTVTTNSPPAPTVQTTWPPTGFLAVNASAHRLFQLDQIRGIRVPGSVGASLIYTARGAATAALLPKARLWDLVGGAAILSQAGGELRYLSGQPLDYLALLDGELAPEPILAGHPALLPELQRTIRFRNRGSIA